MCGQAGQLTVGFHFLPRNALHASRGIATASQPSVRLSVVDFQAKSSEL